MSKEIIISDEIITSKIYLIRYQKVMLDNDLAELYQVETKRLNEQIKRNIKRFPEDFMFRLTKEEWTNLKSHFATSSWGGRRKEPFVFTRSKFIKAGLYEFFTHKHKKANFFIGSLLIQN